MFQQLERSDIGYLRRDNPRLAGLFRAKGSPHGRGDTPPREEDDESGSDTLSHPAFSQIHDMLNPLGRHTDFFGGS
ncbi:unnamed protein product [marine sediment metagenome]|uniref:Uncharacterized protein n=1 Tax=marine sediment metagenome TaxID=412755 RepID=X0WRZ3_9ZZZZ